MPKYKVKYQGEVHDINWDGPGKPSKDELRLAISNNILDKEAPPKLNNNYGVPELPAPPSPSKFTPKSTGLRGFVEAIEPGAFDEPRADRSMFSFDSNKMSDIASRAPEPLRKPLAFAGSLAGEIGQSIASDPESVLAPGLFKGYKRGFPKALPDLPEPAATRLEIPETPPDFADAPIPRGATTYGIRPRPTDNPMLAHVPERYQPTSPNQQYFDQMLPSSMRERIKAPPVPESILPQPQAASSVGSIGANELKGSTLGQFLDEAADTGLPPLPQPGEYTKPSMFSNIMNLTKSLKTTGDLSAPLRQGLPRIHTKEYWQSLKPMMKSLLSDEGYQAVKAEIQNHPALPIARDAKLAIFEREEQVASNLAEKIPGLGKLAERSNAAYDAFIKKLRMDTFNNLIQDAVKSGREIDPNFTRNIAEVINTATGRGTLGDLEKHAGLLNNVFFSPKFISSRVQMFNPQYYMKLDPASRQEAIKSTMSLITFGTGLASLAHLAGAEVETDSTSSDYGKIKIGNARMDPYAGMQQYVVLMSKIAQQQQKSPVTGNVREFDGKYGSPTALGAAARFGQNKLNPVMGFGAKMLEGTDYAGKPLNIPKEVAKQFIPMLYEDTADAIANDPSMLPMLIPSALGMGVQRFEEAPEDTSRKSRSSRKGRKARK